LPNPTGQGPFALFGVLNWLRDGIFDTTVVLRLCIRELTLEGICGATYFAQGSEEG
jgi:hypothetical protein